MKYALIIGNDKYTDPILARLSTPGADTWGLAHLLRDEKIGNFDEVIPLINQTEGEIRRALSSFLANKKPDDLIVVYFSGHGVLDARGRLFLALKDTQTNMLTATALPSSFIADELDNCRSKRQILILDCCHSGAFARGVKAGEQKAMTATTFEGNGYGRVVLTASDATQFALEGDQVINQTELSLFTHFLLEGLRTGEADTDSDGYISLDEWYEYAYSKVLTITPNQIPHKWSYHQQGELVIAKNPTVKKNAEGMSIKSVGFHEKSVVTSAPPSKTRSFLPGLGVSFALLACGCIVVVAALVSYPLVEKRFFPSIPITIPTSTHTEKPTVTQTENSTPVVTLTFNSTPVFTLTVTPKPTSTPTIVRPIPTLTPTLMPNTTLYTWYSPSREDNLVSTAWGDTTNTQFPDYRFVRIEGYIRQP